MNLFNLFRHPTQLKDLTSDEIAAYTRQNPSPVILDVRTRGEFRSGHITGARSYPLGNESNIISDYGKDSRVILICRTGHRSQAAAIELLKRGCTDVSHLRGGMNTWMRDKKPISHEER